MNNLINQIREVGYTDANSIIRRLCGIVNFFSSEKEKTDFVFAHGCEENVVAENRVSYGDWQTPESLAAEVCGQHLLKHGSPDIVIEPTCGLGAFVFTALETFPTLREIHALEINRHYTDDLKYRLLLKSLLSQSRHHPDIYIYNADFFGFDFSSITERAKGNNWNLAIIGNPPWVTNSRQGMNNSTNIPLKHNAYKLKGIDAITGKSNFDISEYMTLHLLKLSQVNKGGISFLLKNSVIRSIMVKQKTQPVSIGDIEQNRIDATSEFGVSVDASCFVARFGCAPSMQCAVKDFYSGSHISDYGWVGDSFVSNTAIYHSLSRYDNRSAYVWRSGIKHDCASVLELTLSDGVYVNGLGETVGIEDDLIFPLLKSSDINNFREDSFRKHVIVPQRRVGDDTSALKYSHPLAYSYLSNHEAMFASRKSSIYKGKDRFSIFGIGDYSFKPHKIIVSSLYKTINFILVSEFNGKPIIVDDTCYQLGFDDIETATRVFEALNSSEIQSLLKSLIFLDAKRVLTKGILMRLDVDRFCKDNGFKTAESAQLSLFD